MAVSQWLSSLHKLNKAGLFGAAGNAWNWVINQSELEKQKHVTSGKRGNTCEPYYDGILFAWKDFWLVKTRCTHFLSITEKSWTLNLREKWISENLWKTTFFLFTANEFFLFLSLDIKYLLYTFTSLSFIKLGYVNT